MTIKTPRRAWQSAVALWIIAAGGALLVPEPKPAKAGAPAIEDVRALLAARSPGAREDGALFQTKLSLLDRYNPGNHERSLGNERYHPGGGTGGVGGYPVGGVPGGTDGLPAPGGGGDGPVDDGNADGPGPSFADNGGGIFPGIGGAVGGGGGGAGAGGGDGTVPTPPAAAALPEPATWLCMIVGFFAVGVAARRRRVPGAPAFR